MDGNGSELSQCDFNDSVTTFELYTIGYIIPEILLSVFIACGNILVLVAIVKFPELRTCMNVYVVSLALADLCIAAITLPLHVAIYVFPILRTVFVACMMRYCLLIISAGTSSITLMLIAVDRYYAIEKPFEYSRVMRTDKAKWISLGAWVGVFSFGSLPLFGWNEWSPCSCISTVVLPDSYLIVVVIFIASNIVVMCLLNVKICFTANKVSADIQSIMSMHTGPTSTANKTRNTFIKNKKAVKVLFLMSGAFTLCFLPFGIYLLWEINCVDKTARWRYNVPRVATAYWCLVNSGLNPIIYHRRIPEFNMAFRRLLGIQPKGHDPKQSARSNVMRVCSLQHNSFLHSNA